MKGIRQENKCPECGAIFKDEEYDFEDDMCLYCKYPETMKHKSVPYDYTTGVARNRTIEGQVLDNIERIPNKQSIQSEIRRSKYKFSKNRSKKSK